MGRGASRTRSARVPIAVSGGSRGGGFFGAVPARGEGIGGREGATHRGEFPSPRPSAIATYAGTRIASTRKLTQTNGFLGWPGSEEENKEVRNFFFEKKKQKTFIHCRRHGVPWQTQCGAKQIKVFWFFFSKKNTFPCFLVTAFQWSAPSGSPGADWW